MWKALQLVVPFLMAVAGSLALTPVVRRLAFRIGAVDQPDPRKVHRKPMPLLGGLAVIGSVAGTFLVLRFGWSDHAIGRIDHNLVLGTALGVLPVTLASLWDDLRSLPPWPRFLAQFSGAAIAVGYGVCLPAQVHLFDQSLHLGVMAVPLSLLWIVGVTNAFNLIDGLDGLSAGLALVSAGSLAAVFSVAHQPEMAAATIVIAGALVGFLPYNMHPAKIFLGDTGAASIGFVLACFALVGGSTLSSGLAAAMPIFIMGLPIADTLVAMLRRSFGRLTTGQGGMFQPDRDHFHHRLMALGVTHRHAVFILYGAGLTVAAVGLLSTLVTAFEAGLLLMGLTFAAFVGIARLGYDEFAVVRNGLVLKFYDAPVLRRSFFAVFADIAMVVVGVAAAMLLRFDGWDEPEQAQLAIGMGGVLVPATVVVLWAFRMYRGAWRLAGLNDFRRLGLAVCTAGFVGYLAHGLMFPEPIGGRLAVFAIHTLVMLVMAGGARASYRMFRSQRAAARQTGVPVLVYGAGVIGGRLLPQLLGDDVHNMRPVGFLDDDPEKMGKIVNGIQVWGGVTMMAEAVGRTGARRIVLAAKGIPRERQAYAHAECERLGIELLRLSLTFEPVDESPGELPRLPFAEAADVAEEYRPVGWAGADATTRPASAQ